MVFAVVGGQAHDTLKRDRPAAHPPVQLYPPLGLKPHAHGCRSYCLALDTLATQQVREPADVVGYRRLDWALEERSRFRLAGQQIHAEFNFARRDNSPGKVTHDIVVAAPVQGAGKRAAEIVGRTL